MSETSKQSTPEKVTAVEKSEKTKDPRKVELGKKLAKISKEAKERKARMRNESARESEQEQSLAEEINEYVDFRYIVGGITIISALGGLYYAYKSDKIQTKLFEQNKALKQDDHVSELSDRAKRSDRTKSSGPQVQQRSCDREVLKQSDCEPKYENTKCKPSTKLSCIENL